MPDESQASPGADIGSGHDADRQQIGAVYAKALLGATEKAGNSEAVLEELESLIDDVLAAQPKLNAAWTSPRVPNQAKIDMIDKALSGRASRELVNFLKVVARNGRLDCLRAIRTAARSQLNELRGRVAVTVKTADRLSDEQTHQVSDRLRQALGRELDLKLEVDPDLIGGLLVRVGDTVYDGTVAQRLERLREKAVRAASQQIRQAVDRFAVAGE